MRGRHHIAQRRLRLRPPARLQAAVRIHPEIASRNHRAGLAQQPHHFRLARLTGKPAAAPGSANTSAAPPAPAGVLRKCVIDGKTVLSDVDCKDGKVVKAIDTRGIEAPKPPKPDPAESAPRSATDKMIEKATQ